MEPPPDPSGRSALDRIRAVEDEIRQSRWDEIAVVLDATTGEEIWRKQDAGTAIVLSTLEMGTMRDCVLTHNHPVGWRYAARDPRRAGSSFSGADIRTAIAADVFELRAVTPLLRFSLKRPDTGWPDSSEVLASYAAIERQVMSLLFTNVNEGLMSDEDASARLAHEVMLRLAHRYDLHYVREVK